MNSNACENEEDSYFKEPVIILCAPTQTAIKGFMECCKPTLEQYEKRFPFVVYKYSGAANRLVLEDYTNPIITVCGDYFYNCVRYVAHKILEDLSSRVGPQKFVAWMKMDKAAIEKSLEKKYASRLLEVNNEEIANLIFDGKIPEGKDILVVEKWINNQYLDRVVNGCIRSNLASRSKLAAV